MKAAMLEKAAIEKLVRNDVFFAIAEWLLTRKLRLINFRPLIVELNDDWTFAISLPNANGAAFMLELQGFAPARIPSGGFVAWHKGRACFAGTSSNLIKLPAYKEKDETEFLKCIEQNNLYHQTLTQAVS